MLTEEPRVSLADLAAAGVRLHPADAVAIVRELILRVIRGDVPGVPSAHVIRLLPSGHVTIEGPVAASGRAVSRAATLLDSLLPPFDAPSEFRAPGALRLVIARALGTLDVPPYASLQDFTQALQRFGQPDAQATIRRLVDSWSRAAAGEAPESPPPEAARGTDEAERNASLTALTRREPTSLTVSDVRRARRATGLSLTEISTRSRIPLPLLRQLEWGYLLNWPADRYGRTQLVRYARAAGLDEQAVLAIVWPLIEMIERERERTMTSERADAGDSVEAVEVRTVAPSPQMEVEDLPLIDDPVLADVQAEPVRHAVPSRTRRGSRTAAAAALLVAAATLAVFLIPGVRTGFDPAALPFLEPASQIARRIGDVVPLPSLPDAQDAEVRGLENASAPATGGVDQAELTGAADAAPATLTAASGAGEIDAALPAFTSVGSAMFFNPQEPGDAGLMRTADSTGGAYLRITRVVDDNARNFHARLSPDGTRIAFDSDRDGERGVYVAAVDGSNVRRVSGDGFAAIPSWAPDGGGLVFVRAEPDNPRVWNLWLVDLESGDRRRLTSHETGQPWGASWFPDGRRVAYTHQDRLLVLNVETGQERVFASPRKGRQLRTPAVSPDGERVIFHVERDGAWLLRLEDESMRKVLADPTAEEYAWSPDGRRVAYHSRQSGEWGVWLMLQR